MDQDDHAPRRKRGRPRRASDDLLIAAARVFARDGFIAATMEVIAAEANASPTTLYKIFGSKAELFFEVMRSVMVTGTAIDPTADGQDSASGINGDPLRTLYFYLQRHYNLYLAPNARGLLRAYVGAFKQQSHIFSRISEQAGDVLMAPLLTLVRNLRDDGLIENAPSYFCAQMLLAFVERFTVSMGLVVGDDYKPEFDADYTAGEALLWLLGRYGTQKGKTRMAGIAAWRETAAQ